jgi:hypothetical protein
MRTGYFLIIELVVAVALFATQAAAQDAIVCTGGQVLVAGQCACPDGSVWIPEVKECAKPVPLPVGTIVVVTEFYSEKLNHYFITANPDEVMALSNTPALGWQRTGTQFQAYLRSDFPSSAAPVCRFYGDFVIGPNSHFYTADSEECAYLNALQKPRPYSVPQWNFEEISFAITRPTAGVCPADTRPVYRVYNDRASRDDSNHRYLTSRDKYDVMIAGGWRREGVVMCAVP